MVRPMTSTQTSSVLDEAFDRMAASSAFELPNGFVNHGPMACEALDALGLDQAVGPWSRRFERVPGPAVVAVRTPGLDWRESLGDYSKLPLWIGHLELEIEQQGWREVVEIWVPRLLPALSTRLFHGAIRAGHATRAIARADTPSRRAELARALGYWAARFAPGQPIESTAGVDVGSLKESVVTAAAGGARSYLSDPSIFSLHGVTGAMAVDLLADHIPPAAVAAGLGQIRAEHAALYAQVAPVTTTPDASLSLEELGRTAEHTGDVHAVKLVEACMRGFAVTGDDAFVAAAEQVTGLKGVSRD
jgi:hypothetical protein